MLLTAAMPATARTPSKDGRKQKHTDNSRDTVVIRDKIYAFVFMNKLL
jgi:hypothetical protein